MLDIKGAGAGHPPSGPHVDTHLVQRVTMYEPVDDSVVAANKVCVRILIQPGGTKTILQMCAKQRSDGQGLGSKIFRVVPGPKEETGFFAKVLRPNQSTVVFAFPKEAIGNPRSYSWQALTGFSDGSTECPVVPPQDGKPRYGCED